MVRSRRSRRRAQPAARAGESSSTMRLSRRCGRLRVSASSAVLPGAVAPQPERVCARRPLASTAAPVAERKVFSELVGREAELARLVSGSALADGRAASRAWSPGLARDRAVAELRKRMPQRSVEDARSLTPDRSYTRRRSGSFARDADEDDSAASLEKLDASSRPCARSRGRRPLLATCLGRALEHEERERLAAIPADALEKLVRSGSSDVARDERRASQRGVDEDLHWGTLVVSSLDRCWRLASERPTCLTPPPGFAYTSDRVLPFAREKLRHAMSRSSSSSRPGGAPAIVNNLSAAATCRRQTPAAIADRARAIPLT